jgi:uncharacterized membrane protein
MNIKPAILLLLIDSVFVMLISGNYRNMVQSIQNNKMRVNLLGVLLSYFTLIFAYYWFIMPKVNELNSMEYKKLAERRNVVFNAFILGLVLYGVYDFTNMAIFTKWNPWLALLDVLWGGILFSSLTVILLGGL